MHLNPPPARPINEQEGETYSQSKMECLTGSALAQHREARHTEEALRRSSGVCWKVLSFQEMYISQARRRRMLTGQAAIMLRNMWSAVLAGWPVPKFTTEQVNQREGENK